MGSKYLCSHCGKSLSAIEAAKAEMLQELFDKEVEKKKVKLLEKKSFWSFIPFTIEIKRRNTWQK